MSSTAPSIRPFGPYLLLRTTGTDPLGTVYRAGTLGQPRLQPFLLLRVFDGATVDRQQLLRAMELAVDTLDAVRGPAVAAGAVLGAVDDVPFAGVEDRPGQSLEALLEPHAGDAGLPPELALLVSERILAALESARPLEAVSGAAHGFLVPSFVHVSYDGETRVFGFGLGSGLLPALRFPKARQSLAPYIAPEVLESGRPTTSGDIYSASALLCEALTGRPPVPGRTLADLETATLADSGALLPEPLRQLLRRGLSGDPAGRERDLPAFRSAVNALLYGGSYTASTFNLAFFMQHRFEKAILSEKREREAEERLVVARPSSAVSRPAMTPPTAPATLAPDHPTPARARQVSTAAIPPAVAARRKHPLGGVPVWVVAAAAAVLLSAGGYLAYRLRLGTAPKAEPPPAPAALPAIPAPAPTPVVVGKEDPLFQAAVQARLQEELKRRERERQAETQREQKKRAVVAARAAEEARKAAEAEEAARAARDRNDRDEELRLAREGQEARKRAAAAARVTPTLAVREGDLVDISKVDSEPVPITTVRTEVPSLAKEQVITGMVRLRVLVNERGQTEAVEILQDTTPRVGLAESSRTAVQRWTWTPATKNGRKVRTWTTVAIPFGDQ